MKPYEEARDEAAVSSRIKCGECVANHHTHGFMEGADWGKSFSDKQNETDNGVCTNEAVNNLASIWLNANGYYRRFTDIKFSELCSIFASGYRKGFEKTKPLAYLAIKPKDDEFVNRLQDKLLAQESIIANMEEALECIVYRYQGNTRGQEECARDALTALKEFRDNK